MRVFLDLSFRMDKVEAPEMLIHTPGAWIWINQALKNELFIFNSKSGLLFYFARERLNHCFMFINVAADSGIEEWPVGTLGDKIFSILFNERARRKMNWTLRGMAHLSRPRQLYKTWIGLTARTTVKQ